MEANYVRIQSTRNIHVNAGLYYEDVTNRDAHIPDRLKVNPTWPNTTLLIKEGVGTYPVEVSHWPVVRSLEKQGILTISACSETTVDDQTKKQREKLLETMEKVEKKAKKNKTLTDIAGE